jgi:hypothetical protein
VPYRPAHKRGVVALQRELWSTDARANTRYFDWKYEGRPRPAEPLLYLALHEGEVVGMRGFHEATLEAGTPSRRFRVLMAGDALIAPAHRDRGLVPRIMALAHADLAGSGYPWLVSYAGANRINTLGLLTLGWRSAGPVRPMGLISARAARDARLRSTLAELPVLWRLSDARFFASAGQRHPFRQLDAAAARVESQPLRLERTPRIDAMVELVERLGHDGRIRYVRDGDYLAWRFRNPLSSYRFLYWEEAGRLEGYLVLGRRTSDLGGWDRVYVADLEASRMDVRAALLSAALRWGRFPDVVTWTASLNAEELELLRREHFVPVDPQDTSRGCPCILVRPATGDAAGAEWMLGGRAILEPASWDIRALYSMRG